MTFFALFSLMDLIIFSIIFLAMLSSVWADDRSNNEGAKWLVVFVSLIVVAVMFWSSWTLASVFAYLTSVEFLQMLVIYVVAGAVYAAAKFLIKTRSVALQAGRMWKDWLGKTCSGYDPLPDGTLATNQFLLEVSRSLREMPALSTPPGRNRNAGPDMNHQIWMITSELDNLCGFFRFSLEDDAMTPRVRTIRSFLVEHLVAWIIFWPMYLLVNVLGDAITSIAEWTGRVVMRLTSGLVTRMFDNNFSDKR